MGQGSEVVPTGQVDRFYLSGAGEGDSVVKSFGRVRLGGQVIWASRFREDISTSGGSGKGSGGSTASSSYTYSVSLALALGEGVITRVGRVWADGAQVAKDDFNLRVYLGGEAQLPDAKIEAVEGEGLAPAFRGTAYVVIEDLDLGQFGNRVPQFSFEVFRRAQPAGGTTDPGSTIKAIALIPGTGEYGLATTPVHFDYGLGVNRSINVNSASGKTDFATSIEDMRGELGAVGSVSLVVSWFGDDLKCGSCQVTPRVEQVDFDGVGMPWQVSGVARSAAQTVSEIDDRPVFGGTPTDESVVEAIVEITSSGQDVMFYPFILMDIQASNGLGDPWSSGAHQATMPWRGRITLSAAPGQAGSTDETSAAEAEVATFFGLAQVSDFTVSTEGVDYFGPAEWSYRRFILHNAYLCSLAGGVLSFCIGSEMRSLTQIRGAAGSFPAVDAMITLAADVRSILGPDTKIGYAADWSEYFGYQPQDGTGDRLFHLDPFWADENVDFIGIDNYMPLSDWRDGREHLDADAGSIYSLEYLCGNIAGGEGFDWYYANAPARDFQIRSPIEDGAYGEDWIYRFKDIKSWWTEAHHERIDGIRQSSATAWVPESKPIWFAELGCAAIDKGCNQPNAFVDEKSSESQIPYYSNGLRDDLMQAQYLRAMISYYDNVENNPISTEYEAPMVDMDRAHVWAWDARPWPEFPANLVLWSDGDNYARGHWLNGRLGAQALGDVITETCEASGVDAVDVSGLYGSVTGYIRREIDTARAALQPLMLTFGLDAVEENGTLRFQNRVGIADGSITPEKLVWTGEDSGATAALRAPEAEVAGQVRVGFIRGDGTYEVAAAEAVFPDETALGVSKTDVPIVMTIGAAQAVAERWLAEARVARESVSLTLPPSQMHIGAGDVVELPEQMGGGLVRVDRVEDVGARNIEATRIDPAVYERLEEDDSGAAQSSFVAPVPVFPLFLDLPLLTGDEVEHAPHLAVTATPWPGSVAVYSSTSDVGYELNTLVVQSSVIGITTSALFKASPSRWDNGSGVTVALYGGAVSSADMSEVLNGANVAAIGDGTSGNWEVFQFADAELLVSGEYQLSTLLRGQAGSEAIMPDDWPVGSYVVMLDGVPGQIDLVSSARDLARHYRIGPAPRDVSDSSYIHEIEAFSGNGLKPYAPAHLRGALDVYGDRAFSWIRRSRVDGDSWGANDVPLGETYEAYRLRVLDEIGALVRQVDLSAPTWAYSMAMQTADGITGDYSVEVAQISERFGAGSFARIEINC
jgi:hypothetical protein